MANQLSADAKRVSQIIDEIEDYNNTISELEYKICDVPQAQLEEDKDDLIYEQRCLQAKVNTMTNDLKFDDNVKIEYDGKVTQVRRKGVLWLEYYPDHGWREMNELRTQLDLFEHDLVEYVQSVTGENLEGGIIEEL